jgi:hypothetical protein
MDNTKLQGDFKNRTNSHVTIHCKKECSDIEDKNVDPKCKEEKEGKYLDTIIVTQSTVGIIIPEGASFMEILLVGGGGGGGNSGDNVDIMPKFGGGGGGGAGTYKNPNFCISSAGSIDIEIGMGGLAGPISGSNGQNGGNTIFTYNSFSKIAFGGEGGRGSFNGSLGGKGGEASGLGSFGDDGHTNIYSQVPGMNQQGGYGGLSGLCETSPYGNGGRGLHQVSNVHIPYYPIDKPYNLLHNGTHGFAKLIFYSIDNCDSVVRPSYKLKEIHIKNDKFIYVIDPNTSLTVVDTSNFAVNLSLGGPCCPYKKITIKLAYSNGLSAYVMPITGGTFELSAANPILELVFDKYIWTISDNTEKVNSFYPTTQYGPLLVPQDFKVNSTSNIIVTTAHSNGVTIANINSGTTITTTTVVAPSSTISAGADIFGLGEPNEEGGIGATRIYTLQNDKWVQHSKLIGTGYIGSIINQGSSISMSADGNTLAVGGFNDNYGRGAVWIFHRIFDEWIQQGLKLISPEEGIGFGFSVSLSSNGDILVVGEPNTPNGGGAWIFDRRDTFWNSVTHLEGLDPIYNDFSGFSVDISAEGTTIAMGSNSDKVKVFIYKEGVWIQDGLTLIGESGSMFGFSVVLSGDGNTLAIGSPMLLSNLGGVAIYIRKGGIWMIENTSLTVPSASPLYQGYTLDLSADGNTLVVGGNSGNLYVWTRINSNWTSATKLVNSQIVNYFLKGYSPTLSDDGSTLIATNYPVSGKSSTVLVYI